MPVILTTCAQGPTAQKLKFRALVHLTGRREDRRIEQAFYDRHSAGGFDGDHIELEILEPRVWEHTGHALHFHRSEKNSRNFVCWTYQIRDLEQAERLLECWALATLYTMVRDKECPPLHDGKFAEYIQELAKLGFTIVEER